VAAWSRKRRWLTIVSLLVVGVLAVIGRPAIYLIRTALSDRNEIKPVPSGMADDVSRLNATQIAKIWDMPADDAEAEKQLGELLQEARSQGLRISIAGFRHSMGGQTIYPGGIVVNMLPHNQMRLDEQKDLLHVQAGARWADILPFLDAHLRSVAIMQSYNSFSVGGSLSVNCHGWQHNRPPIASSVESLRLMTSDGKVLRCSRSENAELFSLALGGYGLLGIILDADLRVVPNERYRVEQFVIPGEKLMATWDKQVEQRPNVGMACARLSIVPSSFLGEAILYLFIQDPLPSGQIPALAEPGMKELTRTIFRGQVESDYGKELRWTAERDLQKHLAETFASRNQLLNDSVDQVTNRSAASTDILHEYFVPRDRYGEFLGRLRVIVPQHHANLLNVTVREVCQDNDSMLRYADGNMVSFVLLFNQPFKADGEKQMQSLTQDLIDAALASRGRYYLPYRLHATPRQFEQAYPQARRFFELKRHYDPDELFQNEFYVKYGHPRKAPSGP
jgi:FAD/FMN-containing dehydrogenase